MTQTLGTIDENYTSNERSIESNWS